MSNVVGRSDVERQVQILADTVALEGTLCLPAGARSVVAFASGDARNSSHNRYMAHVLQSAGLATLLVDLLTPDEQVLDQRTARFRFDIELLAARLAAATRWLEEQPATRKLRVGYLGSGTGTAATLMAAAAQPERVGAIVSRGGRPDLAGPALADVRAPTLLIVGGNDTAVIARNQLALAQLPDTARLEIVASATHQFDDPGGIEKASRLANAWFRRHLSHGED